MQQFENHLSVFCYLGYFFSSMSFVFCWQNALSHHRSISPMSSYQILGCFPEKPVQPVRIPRKKIHLKALNTAFDQIRYHITVSMKTYYKYVSKDCLVFQNSLLCSEVVPNGAKWDIGSPKWHEVDSVFYWTIFESHKHIIVDN